jgi:hypothetical protein
MVGQYGGLCVGMKKPSSARLNLPRLCLMGMLEVIGCALCRLAKPYMRFMRGGLLFWRVCGNRLFCLICCCMRWLLHGLRWFWGTMLFTMFAPYNLCDVSQDGTTHMHIRHPKTLRPLFLLCLLLGSLMLAGCRPPTVTRTLVTTATARPSLTPPISPTPAPPTATSTPLNITRIPPCPDAPPRQLILRERAQVTDNGDTLNLRSGAGTDFDILLRLEPLAIFFVLEGPECADGYTWFRVRYNDVEGWIAEGEIGQYYAVPYLTG